MHVHQQLVGVPAAAEAASAAAAAAATLAIANHATVCLNVETAARLPGSAGCSKLIWKLHSSVMCRFKCLQLPSRQVNTLQQPQARPTAGHAAVVQKHMLTHHDTQKEKLRKMMPPAQPRWLWRKNSTKRLDGRCFRDTHASVCHTAASAGFNIEQEAYMYVNGFSATILCIQPALVSTVGGSAAQQQPSVILA